MRTTLTIDEDVAALLKSEVHRSGEPFKQTVNRILRSGLSQTSSGNKPKPFKVKPFDFELPPGWTSGNVQKLIEMVEGPTVR